MVKIVALIASHKKFIPRCTNVARNPFWTFMFHEIKVVNGACKATLSYNDVWISYGNEYSSCVNIVTRGTSKLVLSNSNYEEWGGKFYDFQSLCYSSSWTTFAGQTGQNKWHAAWLRRQYKYVLREWILQLILNYK